jgi:hypothetical protein
MSRRQAVRGAIPTHWPMRTLWSAAAGEEYLAFLALGVAVNLVAHAVALRAFEHRLLRRG